MISLLAFIHMKYTVKVGFYNANHLLIFITTQIPSLSLYVRVSQYSSTRNKPLPLSESTFEQTLFSGGQKE